MSFLIILNDNGFDLVKGDDILLSHSRKSPAFMIGQGRADIEMLRGNFAIEDVLIEQIALNSCRVNAASTNFSLWNDARPDLILRVALSDDTLTFSCSDPTYNRLWIDIRVGADEHIWGGGEQMSYLALNGRRFPFWTSEPGVGRDKSTALTQMMDAQGGAGGDYWSTNYPQPTWLSSRRYAGHLATEAYSVFDLSEPGILGIECWTTDVALEFFEAPTLAALVTRLSDRFGRQPQLPDWAIEEIGRAHV